MDAVHFGIDFWGTYNAPMGLTQDMPGNLVDQFPCFVALLEQAAAGEEEFVDALVSA